MTGRLTPPTRRLLSAPAAGVIRVVLDTGGGMWLMSSRASLSNKARMNDPLPTCAVGH